MGLIAQLKRRNVFKVCVAYLALFWVAIEVAITVTPLLGLPDWLPTVALWVGIIGFPVVAVLSWVYELTPDGVKRDTDVSATAFTRQRSARRLDVLIIALIAVGVVLFAYDRFGPGRQAPLSAPGSDVAINQGGVTDRPAVAVLPFDNLSSDPEQAYFADGLAEDLITRLASWRAFPVIARNSSFQFRGGDVDLQDASMALSARFIVQGSVRRVADRIRVTAQLIDASTSENVWADSYDGDVSDVFALQDELSGLIAASLVDDLNRVEAERAKRRGTTDLEAWGLFQLGLQHADAYTRDEFARAREYFSLAAERDPAFATPLAHQTFVDLWHVVLGWSEAPMEDIDAALELARRAASLDPRDPAAQAALGWAYIMSGDLENGLVAARLAVELNPSMPEALGWLSWNLLVANDPEGVITYGERAQRLNPLGGISAVIYDNLSQAHWQLGNFQEGLSAARRLVAELPDYYIGYVLVAMNLAELGQIEEAREAIATARQIQPDLSQELFQAMYGVSRPEVDARRNALLRQFGVE
jgi:TolB-like protein/Flp pilus assembly protein TadD